MGYLKKKNAVKVGDRIVQSLMLIWSVVSNNS